ncbi:MAG: hypothetical protein CMJ83_08565 [Planctomycetes bacterium]|nr:hypothetical protein [Planctomycetota bacterium]
MPTIEELIHGLKSDGRVVSRGRFTMDDDKAREKMRRYQLEDPRLYVLELVQAAVRRGATRIDFDIDANDVWMRCDGTPFTLAGLSGVFGSLFESSDRDEHYSLQRLAIGLNAALALDPRHLTLRSGDADGVVELKLRPGQPDHLEVIAAPPGFDEPKTEIHVRDRFKMGHLSEFFRSGNDQQEARYIEERCRYARIPITVNGDDVIRSLADGPMVALTDVDLKTLVGTAGFHSRLQDSQVQIVTDGVLITTHEVDCPVPGFLAIVEARGLKKNVSQTDFVRDDAYHRFSKDLERARELATIKLCHGLRDAPFSELARWADTPIREDLAHEPRRKWGSEDQYPGCLAIAPLWRTVTADQRSVCLRELLEAEARQGFVAYSYLAFPALTEDSIDESPVVKLKNSEERRLVRKLMKGRIREVSRSLENREIAIVNQRRWRATPLAPNLGQGLYAAQQKFENGNVRGEIGLVQVTPPQSRFRLVKDGHLLCEVLVTLPVAGLTCVVEAPFKPTVDWRSACRDTHFKRAVLAAATAVEAVMAQAAQAVVHSPTLLHARPGILRVLKAYLVATTKAGFGTAFLRAFDISKRSASRTVHEKARGLDIRRNPLEVDASDDNPAGAFADLPLFTLASGSSTTLRALGKVVAADGSLRFVSGRPTNASRLEGTVVCIEDPQQQSILRGVFGRKQLIDATEELDRLSAEDEFASTPPMDLDVPFAGPARHRFRDDEFQGVVGLPDPESENENIPFAGALVTVLRKRRQLATIVLPLAPGRTWATIDGDDLPVEITDLQMRQIKDRVAAALPGLVVKVCRYLDDLKPAHRTRAEAFLRSAILAYVPRAGGRKRPPANAADAVAALRAVPLIPHARGHRVSLGSLETCIAESAVIDWVAATFEPVPKRGDVLLLDSANRALLEKRFGVGALRDRTEEFETNERERKLRANPPLERLEVDADTVLARRTFRRDGFEGEIGLSRRHDRSEPRYTYRICTERRQIGTLEGRGPYALTGIVDVANLQLTDEDDVWSQDLDGRWRELANTLAADLMSDLAARRETLDPGAQGAAWRHALDHLAHTAADCRGMRDRLQSPVHRALASWTGFVGADGAGYSLLDLGRSFARYGRVSYVTRPHPGQFADPDDIVILASGYEHERLATLFPKLEDATERWEHPPVKFTPPEVRTTTSSAGSPEAIRPEDTAAAPSPTRDERFLTALRGAVVACTRRTRMHTARKSDRMIIEDRTRSHAVTVDAGLIEIHRSNGMAAAAMETFEEHPVALLLVTSLIVSELGQSRRGLSRREMTTAQERILDTLYKT